MPNANPSVIAATAATGEAGPTPAKTARPRTAAKRARPAADSPADSAAGAGSDWSDADLATVRADLAAELEELQREYEQSLQELNDLQLRNTDGAGDDQADAGSKTFDREQGLSIAANRLDLISQINRAIERVDHGTYGRCEVCGNAIPRVRLEAFPMATLDVECKQREERR